jgi:dTDP-4-dehydrorhamnose reductase
MFTMQMLLLGQSGVIGSALHQSFHDRQWPTVGTRYRQDDSSSMDVRDEDAVRETIRDVEPDVTVLAAPAPGGEAVIRAVAEDGGKLVLFTCGSVFGSGTRAKHEDDAVSPACPTTEAFAKLEAMARQYLPQRHLIVRTNHVFGSTKRGMLGRALKLLKAGHEIECDDTTLMMPTFAIDLAEATCELLKHQFTGTIHAVGPDKLTEFTFLRQVAFLFGHDAELVQPSLAIPSALTRPSVVLNRSRLRGLLGAQAIRPVASALRALRAAPRERLLAA